MHESFLRYRHFRHLKVALGGMVVATVVYWAADPPGRRGGNTWVGWTLGTIAALLMLWLMLFGIRKRSYYSAGAPLRAWLSAHTYLGLTLLLLIPLHAAFQVGWNVHTLAFALTVAVVLSGGAGVFAYGTIPVRMTQNRPGEKLAGLFERVAALDADLTAVAGTLPDTIARSVARCIEETYIGGGLVRQLRATRAPCSTTAALSAIEHDAAGLDGEARERVKKLLDALAMKRTLLQRIRRDVQLKALLDTWLVVHVPLAFAAVAAVAVHVFVVFYYR